MSKHVVTKVKMVGTKGAGGESLQPRDLYEAMLRIANSPGYPDLNRLVSYSVSRDKEKSSWRCEFTYEVDKKETGK